MRNKIEQDDASITSAFAGIAVSLKVTCCSFVEAAVPPGFLFAVDD